MERFATELVREEAFGKGLMTFGSFGEGLLGVSTNVDEQSEERNPESQVTRDGSELNEGTTLVAVNTEEIISFGGAGILSSSSGCLESLGANENAFPNGPTIQDDIAHRSVLHDTFESTLYNKDREAQISFGSPTLLSSSSSMTSIPGSSFEGKRIYYGRRCKRQFTGTSVMASMKKPLNLLQTPLHRLMLEVKQMKSTSGDEPASSKTKTSAVNSTSDHKLWVDRYKPRTFVELLGDERVHRETMTWVKEWDHCVFGKAKSNRRKRPLETTEGLHYEDEYHRPRERILLISGPPGLGKTTLATVVAHQAGYEVMEINASDARTGNVIDDRIRPALEVGSRVGKSKPVLVLIDEIDGATGAGENMGSFIHKLIELTHDKVKKKSKKRNLNDGRRPLLRPIICICNDLYSSSLVRLRPIAKIIRFNKVPDVLLTKRLREICQIEGMRIDAHALGMLTKLGQGDIRSCINALQFISQQDTRRTSEITGPLMRSAFAGMKEHDGSHTSVLSALFSPPTKKRTKELGLNEQESAEQITKFVDRLSRLIDLSGVQEKIALGCFEHYCTPQSLHDLSKYDKAHRWLGAFDVLSAAVRSDREYAVMPYLSYCLIPFHIIFAERGGRRIESSKADWEHYQNKQSHEEIYKSMLGCLGSPSLTIQLENEDPEVHNTVRTVDLRHLLGTPTLQLEFAPLLNRIISPPLRPINRQIIRAEERLTLSRLVSIMIALNLQFVLDRNEDGQPVYRLEPPIEAFVTYDGKRSADIPPPRYATRQVIAAEMEQARERRKKVDHQPINKEKPSTNVFFTAPPAKAETSLEEEQENTLPDLDEDGSNPKPSLSRAQMQIYNQDISVRQAKKQKIDPADKPPTDFFGRPLPAKPKITPSALSGTPEVTVTVRKYRITYKYNEGSSAAVRKPVKMSSLL